MEIIAFIKEIPPWLIKMLPWVIRKFLPGIHVQPKKIQLTGGSWSSNFSFFVFNKLKKVVFNAYVLVDIGESQTQQYEIAKTDNHNNLELKFADVAINYDVIRFDCFFEDNEKNFILLKLDQLPPESITPFKIKSASGAEVKFKILKYSKKQSSALSKEEKGAVSFEIPFRNKKRKIRLKSISTLIKKND
jgi:hypothetical protein